MDTATAHRIAHDISTLQAAIRLDVTSDEATEIAILAAATPAIMSWHAPRVFHRDGCLGIVVDQYGNEE